MTTKSRWRTAAAAVAVAALAAGILGAMPANAEETGAATTASPAEEQYRPYLHFSPERNWMNDPNGLVYDDGTWHLFFQHNPYGTRWGNMSWGHATSTDLVHWEEQPLAIPQTFDENGVAIEDIFSGSVVVDEQNTSGFGTAENPPMVAIYTSAYTPAHPTHRGHPGAVPRLQHRPRADLDEVRGQPGATTAARRTSATRRSSATPTPTRASPTGSWSPSRHCSTRSCSPAATT